MTWVILIICSWRDLCLSPSLDEKLTVDSPFHLWNIFIDLLRGCWKFSIFISVWQGQIHSALSLSLSLKGQVVSNPAHLFYHMLFTIPVWEAWSPGHKVTVTNLKKKKWTWFIFKYIFNLVSNEKWKIVSQRRMCQERNLVLYWNLLMLDYCHIDCRDWTNCVGPGSVNWGKPRAGQSKMSLGYLLRVMGIKNWNHLLG